jgi:predicted Fe-Mo cluster-binding NifX family protein
MEYIDLPVSQQHSGNARRIAQIARDYGYEQIVIDGSRVWRRK